MAAGADDPEHLLVAQNVFAGNRFWAPLDRLGHDGHRRYLAGFIEPTSRYELRRILRERPIAKMDVRAAP